MIILHRDFINPIIITKYQSGYRLDQALSQLIPNYSRSQIKKWILQGKVTLHGSIIRTPKKKVFEGESIKISNISENIYFLKSENIPLNIVYEDDNILIINKPSNLVVHPGSGNYSGTLLNSLLFHYPSIASVPRAGIIQRLDKDTTGLMLIAKNVFTRMKLIQLFQTRKIVREYEGIVIGNILNDGMVNQPIARHFVNRTCMAVCPYGKPAITHYQVIEKFSNYTRVRLQLESGRTHQIRVHMAYIRHPLIGDQKYGKFKTVVRFRKSYQKIDSNFFCFYRQALHASMLKFIHPITGVVMQCQISLPKDMIRLLEILRSNF